MPIPQVHQGRYIYHMTHLDNLESILQNELLSTNEKVRRGIEHRNISNQSIQNRRSDMYVTCAPNGTVHDYVPFYFCPREPMLLALLNLKNVDQQFIIYLAVKIDVVDRADIVFTSASANTSIPPVFYDDSSELENLRWDLIDSQEWKFSDDDRHAKMAEVLIHNKVSLSDIDFIVVWNKFIKNEVNKLLSKKNLKIEIKYDGYQLNYGGSYNYRNHYFTKFWSDESKSLITGPYFLLMQFEDTAKNIIKKRKNSILNPKFRNIPDAIEQIEQDFSAIPELDEIKNLQTSNSQHWQSVGDHTKKVVTMLEQLEEFLLFSDVQKKILKFAAYLHDIGKGSSQRERDGRQKTDGDHPANALPMLERILSEDIERLSGTEIRQITMLVVYHDLIGDIAGRDRDRNQILDVIESLNDFDMLVAISKADILSLIPDNDLGRLSNIALQWLTNINNQVPVLRDWVLNELE